MMKKTSRKTGSVIPGKILIFIFFVWVIGSGSTPASAITETYLGDSVKLGGYSYGSSAVYLFLTGPNLPANGVTLDNVNARADQGYFTRVDVGGDQRWIYTWNTKLLAGQLDFGTYTVWVVDAPVDRSHLSGHDYNTIAITLGRPSLAVDTPAAVNGSIFIRSAPSHAGVFLKEKYYGMTPLRIDDLLPGSYEVTLSRFGFTDITTQVDVEGGTVQSINATLIPYSGTMDVNTDPPGATIILDGVVAGRSPARLTNLIPGTHDLSFELEGYYPVNRSIEVNNSLVIAVNASLIQVPATPPVSLFPACIALLISIAWLSAKRKQHFR